MNQMKEFIRMVHTMYDFINSNPLSIYYSKLLDSYNSNTYTIYYQVSNSKLLSKLTITNNHDLTKYIMYLLLAISASFN